MDETLRKQIEKDISQNKVLLYMKGTPDFPLCGFSAQVVRILQDMGVAFASKNILEDEALRQGVKEFSNWPTFPQLYVKGELVGGCDIITQMAKTGELAKVLEESSTK